MAGPITKVYVKAVVQIRIPSTKVSAGVLPQDILQCLISPGRNKGKIKNKNKTLVLKMIVVVDFFFFISFFPLCPESPSFHRDVLRN